MFFANLRLFWLRGYKTLLGLLAMMLAALVLCAALMMGAAQYFTGLDFSGITLAVADEDDNPMLETLLDVLGSDEGVQGYASLVMVEAAEAEAMVAAGEATAALVLPEGFLESVMSGENISPVLLLDVAKPLDAFLVTSVAQSAVDMLAGAQAGIQFVLYAYTMGGSSLPSNEVVNSINLDYARFALGRSGMYRETLVSPTGSMPLLPHYLLGGLLFFAMLACPLLYGLLNRRQTAGWASRLQSAGVSKFSYTMAALVFAFFAMLLGLGVLLCGAWFTAGELEQTVTLDVAVLGGVALCALFLALFAYLICNLGPAYAAVGVSFFAAAGLLYLAGGIVPPVLLPEGVARFSEYSPLGWMRDAVAPLYGYDGTPTSLARLGCLCGLLFVLCLLTGMRRRRT